MNDTWGYSKFDQNWKSAEMLILNLIDIAAKGGNYLLNVGPTAEGLIPAQSIGRLGEMGKWLKVNGEAIYATNSLKQYKEGDNIKYTTSKDGKYVYAIVTKKTGNTVNIKQVKPKSGSKIFMLGVKAPLAWKAVGDGIEITMPASLPCEYAWTLKIQS
jgi:alpha-L-fucosidase